MPEIKELCLSCHAVDRTKFQVLKSKEIKARDVQETRKFTRNCICTLSLLHMATSSCTHASICTSKLIKNIVHYTPYEWSAVFYFKVGFGKLVVVVVQLHKIENIQTTTSKTILQEMQLTE